MEREEESERDWVGEKNLSRKNCIHSQELGYNMAIMRRDGERSCLLLWCRRRGRRGGLGRSERDRRIR